MNRSFDDEARPSAPSDAPATADICDVLGDRAQVLEPAFRHFGGRAKFGGEVVCIKVHEDNTLVRQCLEEPGDGRVLVVDGGGSHRCALVGDQIAQLAIDNGWAGLVIHGAVRDTEALATLPLGVLAVTTNPQRSLKLNQGQRDLPVRVAGARIVPGQYLYADLDGVVVLDEAYTATARV